MNPKHVKKLIRNIFATENEELGCNNFQGLLPAFVESELGGDKIIVQTDALRQHLSQCPDCSESYSGLKQVVSLGVDTLVNTTDWEPQPSYQSPTHIR